MKNMAYIQRVLKRTSHPKWGFFWRLLYDVKSVVVGHQPLIRNYRSDKVPNSVLSFIMTLIPDKIANDGARLNIIYPFGFVRTWFVNFHYAWLSSGTYVFSDENDDENEEAKTVSWADRMPRRYLCELFWHYVRIHKVPLLTNRAVQAEIDRRLAELQAKRKELEDAK